MYFCSDLTRALIYAANSLIPTNTTKCGKLYNRLWPVISIVSHIINVAL